MGWWSDVLADVIQRLGKLTILSCYTRSEEKREKFAAKYRCRPTRSLAVVRAGILSAREGRRVEVAEILDSDANL
jgi:hypothetical protein